MTLNTELLIYSGVCAAVLVVVLVAGWSTRIPTAGLPVTYLLSLAMLHWIGMFIHALSWHSTDQTAFVVMGEKLCFMAVLAFAAGSIFVAPRVLRSFPRVQVPRQTVTSNPRLPLVYIVIGTVFFLVLMPILSRISGLNAIGTSGVFFLVVGLCLACWREHLLGHRIKLLCCLLATCAIPLVTVVSIGFIGYGAAAASVVFVFVLSFYRPRSHALLALGLAFFVGLSLFVTYFRDREAIRESVWGEQNFQDRIEQSTAVFRDFEFINFGNPVHLEAIDHRLNQNWLLGHAVDNIESGGIAFGRGESIWLAVVAVVPRVLWPNKPAVAGGRGLVTRFTGLEFAEGTSVGVGHVMELYINFGKVGVVVGFLLIGIVLRCTDALAAINLRQGNWPGFMLWFLPSLSLLQTGGQLSEATSTAAASAILAIVVNKTALGRVSVAHRHPQQA